MKKIYLKLLEYFETKAEKIDTERKTLFSELVKTNEQEGGLSNFEIVTIQLSYFKDRFHDALKDNEPSLVVIHGIGKGVLKQEIYNYLAQFPNIKVGPADAKLYGMGASEIRID